MDYDFVVIGSGPAGEKAAAQAAYFGKSVAVIERHLQPGGAAVHTGTLPSKTLREASLYLSGYKNREIYGVAVSLSPDVTLQKLLDRRGRISNAEASRMRNNLDAHNVDYYQGLGSFVDEHTIRILSDEGDERTITGNFVLVCTGSSPYRPEEFPFDSGLVFDSDDILSIQSIPRNLTILGAGVIGCEYACMFAALGCSVTLIDAREQIMPFLDYEILDRLCAAMNTMDITMILGQLWKSVTVQDGKVLTCLEDGREVLADNLLFAAGRNGNSSELNLPAVGLKADKRGLIDVDDQYRTPVSNIFAAGDIIGFPALASTSMEQGRVAACHAFGIDYKQSLSPVLPYGIYTIPEVSAVGETEESAREKGLDFVVGRSLYSKNARGMITGDLEGVTKLIVDKKTRQLLGVHVIGERATELVHIGQAALVMKAPVDLFIEMVFNYPTLSESYKYAAYHCLGQL
jgi:NAD(P) transhydrogenase